MTDQVAFDALIKSISVKSLVSGDKEGEIRFRFLPTDELLNGLNKLHRADAEVSVGIVAISANTEEKQNERSTLQKGTKRKPKRETEGGEV
jgi:hypothetical protein